MFRFHKPTRLIMTFMASVLVFLPLLSGVAKAANDADDKWKLVIHVTQYDENIFQQTLNMANNLPKILGVDNVSIEIVAQGPGLKLLSEGSSQTTRIASLVPYDNVQFSACGMTMKGIKKKTGKDVVLLPDVKVVKGGILRVMELQKEGWAYARP